MHHVYQLQQKNYKAGYKRQEHSLKRQSKHENQIHIWHRFARTDGSFKVGRWKLRIKRKCKNHTHCTDMKNAFNGLISKLDPAKKRISEHEEMLTETSRTEMQKERRMEKKKIKSKTKQKQNNQELWHNLKRCNICIFGLVEEERG